MADVVTLGGYTRRLHSEVEDTVMLQEVDNGDGSHDSKRHHARSDPQERAVRVLFPRWEVHPKYARQQCALRARLRAWISGEAAYNKVVVCESARDRPHPLRRPFESLHSHKHMLVRLIYKLLVTSVNRYCCPRGGEVKRGGLHILFVSAKNTCTRANVSVFVCVLVGNYTQGYDK